MFIIWFGDIKFATGCMLKIAIRHVSAHAVIRIDLLGIEDASARSAKATIRRGRILDQTESSKQANAGMIVNQFKKDKFPLKIRTN